MPLLGGLLVNLFGGLVAWLTQFVTRKVAFGLAGVAMMTSLTFGLFVLMRGVLASVSGMVAGAPGVFFQAFTMGVPPVAMACVSAYVTVWTACTVYHWQRDLLHIAMRA